MRNNKCSFALHVPAQYVEMVIARNLKKHKLMKHEERTADITRHIEAKSDHCDHCGYTSSY